MRSSAVSLALCCIFVLAACTPLPPAAKATAALPAPTTASTPTPQPTASMRLATPSAQPPKDPKVPAGETPRPTPAPSITPYPTLDAQGRLAFVRTMLATNGGCELPCWWTIVPGQTTTEELAAYFREQGIMVRTEKDTSRLELQDLLDVQFLQSQNSIQRIEIGIAGHDELARQTYAAIWARYQPDQLLTRYGVPDQVYLDLVTGGGDWSPGGYLEYGLAIVYQKLGIAAYYPGKIILDTATWQLCPQLDLGVARFQIHLQAPGIMRGIGEIAAGGRGDLRGTLTELTGMSLQDFYETYRQPAPGRCLVIADPNPHDDEVESMPPDMALSPEREDQLLASRLAGAPGCDLPCWWGIHPGVTTWLDAKFLFQSDGKAIATSTGSAERGREHEVGLYGRHTPYPFDYLVRPTVFERDGIVTSLAVTAYALHTPDPVWGDFDIGNWPPPQHLTQDWQRYSLEQVVARFGPPSRVLLHYWAFGWLYSLVVIYDDRGFAVSYTGPIASPERGSQTIRLCPEMDKLTSFNLWLTASGSKTDLATTVAELGYEFPDRHRFGQMPSLETATGMSVAEFYQAFRNARPGVCWEVARELGQQAP